MTNPTVYLVTKEQVGSEDLQEFLRKAIHKQFEGKEYYISKEFIEEKITHYSPTPRKLRGFSINEGDKAGHCIWFDVTDCNQPVTWVG